MTQLTLRSGQAMPSISLPATNGISVNLAGLRGMSVVYAYPRTSSPDVPTLAGWDLIPGARGCTPQSCAFRDHYAELREAGAGHVFGLSTQQTDYQAEAVARLHLPFALLSDASLKFSNALGLPVFTVEHTVLLRRLTLILRDGCILRVMYPVLNPAENAEETLAVLNEIKNK